MLDDLDVAWEGQQRGTRPRGQQPARPGTQRRRKPVKRKQRSVGSVLLSTFLLLLLGGGVYYGVGLLQDFLGGGDYETNPGKVPVNVVVNEGDGATSIGEELYDKKVVKSVKAFVAAAEADDRSVGIQPGTYKLFEEMPAAAALAMLLDPGKNMLVTKVVIPEGMIAKEIYEKLSKASGVPVADFVAAAKDPVKLGVNAAWFTAKRDDKTPVLKSIEGFLYPATYSFQPGVSAEAMLKEMVAAFNSTVEELDFMNIAQNKLEITPYEALIAASIAEKEAVFKEDFPKVVRVLYNRAYTDASPCDRCLGLDSTVNYWLDITGKGSKASEHLTQAEIDDLKNPYNTHRKPGMPPGAISNPGKVALQAAINPVGSAKVVFFMSIDKEGHMAYAETDSQHQANIRLACKNGIPLC